MAKQPVNLENQEQVDGVEPPKRYCGIVMPIASMPDYDAAHWIRVKDVISDAILSADFVPRLVSESDDVGVIHGHIVQNLYDDEIVVCDVSGKNPNVMFELGMRLAFDKPTIIVQDDSNGYSFDIGPIKHIPYRRDQRFDDVQDFKEKVRIAIAATLAKKQADENFSPFLKHFGHFTPKKVEEHEIPQAEFIMKKLNAIEERVASIGTRASSNALLSNVFAEAKNPSDATKSLEFRALVDRLITASLPADSGILSVKEASDLADSLMAKAAKEHWVQPSDEFRDVLIEQILNTTHRKDPSKAARYVRNNAIRWEGKR